MGHVITFGGYSFPGNGLTFSPSFGDVVPRTGRMPGLDGGFDEYGTGQAPSEVGNITMTFTLIATDRDDMQAKRDAVLALKRKGVQELLWKPQGFTEFRFCRARINNIRIAQTPSAHTDLWQNVSINFQVADPHWYSYPFEVWYLDSGEILDGSLTLGGPTTYKINKAGPELTIDGSADTLPIFTFAPNAVGATCTDITIQRKDENGTVQDEWIWRGLLSYGDRLVVNCRDYTVYHWQYGVGRVDVIEDFTHKRAEFMRLVPGYNNLYFIGTVSPSGNPGKLDLIVDYLEAWR